MKQNDVCVFSYVGFVLGAVTGALIAAVSILEHYLKKRGFYINVPHAPGNSQILNNGSDLGFKTE